MEELKAISGLLLCFWPVWLGIPFVIMLSKNINVFAWRNLYIEKRMAIYSGIVLIFSFLGFIWGSYIFSEVPMAFAYIGSHGMMYPDGFEENRDQIHEELWLRMIMPPSENACFSTEFICDWTDEILENASGENISTYAKAQQWLEYILLFTIFGLLLGFGLTVMFHRLINHRLARHPIRPT